MYQTVGHIIIYISALALYVYKIEAMSILGNWYRWDVYRWTLKMETVLLYELLFGNI